MKPESSKNLHKSTCTWNMEGNILSSATYISLPETLLPDLFSPDENKNKNRLSGATLMNLIDSKSVSVENRKAPKKGRALEL